MLNLKNIEKSFKSNQVIKGLNLNIERSDLIYIHGINGCGKSTLFKIACDIVDIDKGSLEKEKDLKIGALIENPGFLENENLKTNLYFIANLTNSYNEERIKQLCDLFQLDFYSKNSLKSYSVGMRQKVGIIQAVMENQNLVFLDEPTRGLDSDSIAKFIILVNSLVKENKSVVIASHDYLSEIEFTKKYELKNGILLEQ